MEKDGQQGIAGGTTRLNKSRIDRARYIPRQRRQRNSCFRRIPCFRVACLTLNPLMVFVARLVREINGLMSNEFSRGYVLD